MDLSLWFNFSDCKTREKLVSVTLNYSQKRKEECASFSPDSNKQARIYEDLDFRDFNNCYSSDLYPQVYPNQLSYYVVITIINPRSSSGASSRQQVYQQSL